MTEPTSNLLWAAVDRLTTPSSRRLDRDERGEQPAVLAGLLQQQDSTERAEQSRPAGKNPLVVHTVSRNSLAQYAAATRTHATVPSLWDQAVDALGASSADQAEGGGGSIHRTPVDVTLMEQMSDIRDAMNVNLKQRKLTPRDTVPLQMRQLAAHIAGHETQHMAWWTFRFEQWARALAVYLQAVQAQPKPRRLRGTACPECSITAVIIEDATGERVSAPPLVIDFQGGFVRAAECSGCGATWWRGEQLEQLAGIVNPRHADTA